MTQSRDAGTRREEPAGGEGPATWARRRDSTYLPGFGSGSAGRGAAAALPPSFLLPLPPPRSATHNTRRKRKPRRVARVSGSRGVGGRLREGSLVPAEERGRRRVVKTCRRSQGQEGTWRGRWLERGRPGDLKNPLEKEGCACAWLSAEAHCPQGRARADEAVRSGPFSGSGSGWAAGSRVALGAARGGAGRARVADLEPHLSSAGQAEDKVASWGLRPIMWRTCGSQLGRHFRLV